ncbi:MAG: glycosyl transferase [Flavipsychrobacter sp.]|jgi:glycosyltransferase involved in cell wall biosynthesis|nr:glycosyl transferase [Flavipsychrobacter sp.]
MKNPSWVDEHIFDYNCFEEVPQHLFDTINAKLDMVQSNCPLVSVVICAWNEEVNILQTISSLCRMKTGYPFEIVVVNNNSTDNTQVVLDKLNVRSFFQPMQGWGPARQLGLENARGKYILIADADAIYPDVWIDEMVHELLQPEVVCVYGRYSFIGERDYPRWMLYIHEKLKDIVAELRQFKRPFLNAYGISMGFVREYALKVGYVMRNIRGEDGRMCFDLMRFGKIRQLRLDKARAWTFPRVFKKEGSLRHAILNRVKKELNRLPEMFYSMPVHDTKASANEN